jgi:hypothetical protein
MEPFSEQVKMKGAVESPKKEYFHIKISVPLGAQQPLCVTAKGVLLIGWLVFIRSSMAIAKSDGCSSFFSMITALRRDHEKEGGILHDDWLGRE